MTISSAHPYFESISLNSSGEKGQDIKVHYKTNIFVYVCVWSCYAVLNYSYTARVKSGQLAPVLLPSASVWSFLYVADSAWITMCYLTEK